MEHPMKATLTRSSRVVTALLLLGSAGLAADDSRDPLFYDYPALEKLASDGIEISADGTIEVWLWGKGPELAISLGEQKFQVVSDRFAWHHVGQASFAKGQKVAVSFTKNELPDDVTNVPGYLVLVADPAFDPKRMPLGGLRTLYDGSGFKPYTSKEEWLKRREALRNQILISAGLWPMLPKTDLKPQVYGKMLRDGYSIEKVVLEALPGFYLSGNLYRPAPWVPGAEVPPDVKARRDAWEKNRSAEAKPAILCPHGHWRDGRFEPEVQKRCKQLARMGAIVFSYDMVGKADSTEFGHSFLDPQIDLMGFSLFGIQTWNSIRALDFLVSLPGVDTERVACTGASGGGTQTFILAAIDDRVKVAAPIVMVSQDMQGGCSCENASGLRLGTDNSEIAALFAPRPQILVGCTQDWTREFLTKGFPEVHATYKLLDAADRVEAENFDFPHNYNQTTRERVYEFLSKHLFHTNPALSKELPLEAEAFETLSTWDAERPRPANAVDVHGLKHQLAITVKEQAEQYRPDTLERLQKLRDFVSPALDVRLALNQSPSDTLRTESVPESERNVVHWRFGTGPMARVRAEQFLPAAGNRRADTLIVHESGVAGLISAQGQPDPLVSKLIEKGHAVMVIDPFGTGQNGNPITAVAPKSIAHFSCYNRCLAAERVQDIVDALRLVLASARGPVNLVGMGSAGPLCLIARHKVGSAVTATVIDADRFEYRMDADIPPDLHLPGMARIGGLRAVGCLVAPSRLFLHNIGEALDASWIEESYRLSGHRNYLSLSREPATITQIVNSLGD
jgi:hypothetical protein